MPLLPAAAVPIRPPIAGTGAGSWGVVGTANEDDDCGVLVVVTGVLVEKVAVVGSVVLVM
jgi:hypothetical protein